MSHSFGDPVTSVWDDTLPPEGPRACRRASGSWRNRPPGSGNPSWGRWAPCSSWNQARVQPLRLVASLARRAGPLATGLTMSGLETAGDRVVRVHTSRGPISPGAVVLATGSAPAPWGEALPQRAVKGHMISTAPAPFALGDPVASSILVAQLEDGRLLAGGTVDEGDADDAVRDEVVAGLAEPR